MSADQTDSTRFVVPAKNANGIRTNFRFDSDLQMRSVVPVLEKAGWKLGSAITLPQHELAAAVEILKPAPDSLLVVRHRETISEVEVQELLAYARQIAAAGYDCLVFPESVRLEELSEERMREIGWGRIKPVVIEYAEADPVDQKRCEELPKPDAGVDNDDKKITRQILGTPLADYAESKGHELVCEQNEDGSMTLIKASDETVRKMQYVQLSPKPASEEK